MKSGTEYIIYIQCTMCTNIVTKRIILHSGINQYLADIKLFGGTEIKCKECSNDIGVYFTHSCIS